MDHIDTEPVQALQHRFSHDPNILGGRDQVHGKIALMQAELIKARTGSAGGVPRSGSSCNSLLPRLAAHTEDVDEASLEISESVVALRGTIDAAE